MFLSTFERRTSRIQIRSSIHYRLKHFFITSDIHKSTTVSTTASTQFLFQYSSLLKNKPGDNQSRLTNIYWSKPC
jgi:hypothetical protein